MKGKEECSNQGRRRREDSGLQQHQEGEARLGVWPLKTLTDKRSGVESSD